MTVLFKLGGSLLTLPGLADKLRFVANRRSQKKRLILTGGGASADVVRDWSQVHQLNDETAHWLAISSLDLNRQLLERLLQWQSVSSREDAVRYWSEDGLPLFLDFSRFAKAEEANTGEPLPHNWDVTSDSLAAWTAIRWPSAELVLLKSVPAPLGLTAQEASDRSLVDPYFPQLAKQLERISWCDLRAPSIVIEPWLVDHAK
jgi:aspartokinase-like uncharacterized kinase